MRVSWSKRAIKSLTQTSVYILTEFGSRANRKYLQEIQRVSDLLEDNPYMGQIEPLLANKPKEYRSIVKIIYYIKGDMIRVSALWDTQREPKTLLDEVK